MTKLTLCTIARNEEANLQGCLDSVAPWVDEIIVVDTGSTDRTVEIATAMGAKIVYHPWQDDFSAARNAALTAVSEGFILVLDADEQLGPDAGRKIREAIEQPEFDGFRLPLYNADSLDATHEQVLSGANCIGPATLLERLLRYTPDMQWEGIIHEHLTKWFSSGRTIVELDAPIIHYGSVPEVRRRLNKSTRNLKLLKKICDDQPDNCLYLNYYAQELINNEMYDLGSQTIDKAWAIVDGLKNNGRPIAMAITAAVARVAFLMEKDNFDEIEHVLNRARELAGDHPSLHLMTATVHMRRWAVTPAHLRTEQLLDNALEESNICFSFQGKALIAPAMPGVCSWAPLLRIGTVQLIRKDFEAAFDTFDRALGLSTGNVEAILGRAEALIGVEQTMVALNELMPLMSHRITDAWILASWGAYQAEDYESLETMLANARHLHRTADILCVHRLEILDALESVSAAAA